MTGRGTRNERCSDTSIINYDFHWEIEDFTTRRHNRYGDMFRPFEKNGPVFNSVGYVINPSFRISYTSVGYSSEKETCQFLLHIDGMKPEDLTVQFNIVIRSVSGPWIEYSRNETHSANSGMQLCTVVTKGATLRVADKVIGFPREHDFIAMKFHFKMFFINYAPKPTITPPINVPRIKRCNLCSDFKNLYDSKKMSDVTITVDGVTLLAHKLVLVTRSSVFAAMLDHDCLEANTNNIQITDADASFFDNFLKYLYCSEIGDKSYDMVRNLYMLADKYAVDGLKEDCRDILESELNEGTVCQLLEISHLFKDETLKEKAVKFIKQHFSVVSKKPEWIKICKDHPEMASDVLRIVTSFLDQSKSKVRPSPYLYNFL
ncbi:speckle-type POZ protein-like [Parasteatoda tepidariorum]|uniref:speckle-type POZ protein-like n=1 Tax=Parasteatoda tepidariorum TaxID=114398 RepID=UPI00077FBCB4|nr:uncharacterized protein LOC107446603 [Parasteatoda tepidariorum]